MFEVRRVVLPPRTERCYDASEWNDALVIVARGAIELEDTAGRRETFFAGAMLPLVWMPLRSLRNRGPESVMLLAVSRRRQVASA